MGNGKVFISHSSEDSSLVNAFINCILCNGLALNKQEDIFCTSVEGSGIRSGEDFKLRIKNELQSAKAVIQILSPNYKSSEVCLNEMGAAWVLNNIIIPFTVPPIGYDVGFIHANTQQLKINIKEDLLKFYDDWKGSLFNNNVNIANYVSQVDIFLLELDAISKKDSGINSLFYDETVILRGILKERIFSGPPWGEDGKPSTRHQRYYCIELDKPINILTSRFIIDLEAEITDLNYFNQSRLQIFSTIDRYSHMDLSAYKDKRVEIVGTFMGGYTGWHRTDVLFIFTYIGFEKNS